MKNLLLLIFTILLFSSCEDVQTNSPALQSAIDNGFFKSTSSRSFQNSDGSITIEGNTQNELMSLKVASPEIGTYTVEGSSLNSATFQNANGVFYYTNPEGEGSIIITDWDTSTNLLTGTFNYTAINPGFDTLRMYNGVFFEVPFSNAGVVITDGTLSAVADGNTFVSETVTAQDTGASIVVLASSGTSSISITVPIDVVAGFYDLTDSGFSANYTLDSVTEDFLSGSIVIVSHNVETKNLSGTFSFLTENHTIEQGQFNVTYQ